MSSRSSRSLGHRKPARNIDPHFVIKKKKTKYWQLHSKRIRQPNDWVCVQREQAACCAISSVKNYVSTCTDVIMRLRDGIHNVNGAHKNNLKYLPSILAKLSGCHERLRNISDSIRMMKYQTALAASTSRSKPWMTSPFFFTKQQAHICTRFFAQTRVWYRDFLVRVKRKKKKQSNGWRGNPSPNRWAYGTVSMYIFQTMHKTDLIVAGVCMYARCLWSLFATKGMFNMCRWLYCRRLLPAYILDEIFELNFAKVLTSIFTWFQRRS